jgi:hypothetical protein
MELSKQSVKDVKPVINPSGLPSSTQPIASAEDIVHNLALVRQRIAAAAQRAGRNPDDILLVAVSKTHPYAMLQTALTQGQHHFGENRLEELDEKQTAAQQAGQAEAIRWHMIGTIQSRKSGVMARLWRQGGIVLIHSVDTLKLARRLARDAAALGCVLSVLFEINVSGEESKHGFTPDELHQSLPELLALKHLQIQGLMTMAPLSVSAEETRPVFRALRQLRDDLAVAYPQADWRHLSIGMTNDFEVAIEEGATIVRIGSAIFGARQTE